MDDLSDERDFAREVVRTLREAGFQSVWAGGCVRDMQIGLDPSDYDVATDAVPSAVRSLFGRGRTLAVGEAFGVIIVLGPKRPRGQRLQVEVATFRAEGTYSDGRRPDGVVFCTAPEDAARRDFTINGLFYDPEADEVLDFVGGVEDIERGVIRAIGDPSDRFGEDRLRLLRAVRFAARFGFAIEPRTAAAVRLHADALSVVSRERVAAELEKMLRHPGRAEAVRMLVETGLWTPSLPGVDPPSDRTLGLLERLQSPPDATALAALLDDAEPEAVRAVGGLLKLSNARTTDAVWLAERRHVFDRWDGLPLADRKRLLADERCEALFVLEEARHPTPAGLAVAREYRRATARDTLDPPPLLNGGDLKAAGLRPSPRFKELLETVRVAQLNEEIATREDALRLIGLTQPRD